MSAARTGLGIGVIVALAVAIWAAVSSGNDEVPPTSSTSSPASSTSMSTSSSTATTPTTTTSTATSVPGTTDPGARLEEVRLILEDLYFRWFDAIYRKDEEAVMDVIATPERLDAFREAAANHQYPTEPLREQVAVRELELLRDGPDCLVTFSTLDLTGWLGDGMTSSAVDVLWPHDERSWRRASLWTNRNDLWENDCTGERDNELP
jgi:hypothetical protein